MISFCAKELLYKDDKKVSYEIDEPVEITDDIQSTGNTKGRVEFSLRNNFVLATGSFETPLKLICDRCAKEYDITLKYDIDEAIEVNADEITEEDLELTSETLHERIGPEEPIDIEDYIRQYIILNIPTKKICSESCINESIVALNKKAEESVDPRWEKLLKYKDKIKGE